MARVTDAGAGVRIRRAEDADALDVLVVRALSWRAAYGGILPATALARLTERWDRRLPRGTWVAERERIVVGYCMAELAPPAVHIQELYVIPDLWRSGLGSRLLEVVLEAAIQSAVSEATLEVLERNAGGIAFYEARGFHHVKSRDRRIQIDGVPLVTREYRRSLP